MFCTQCGKQIPDGVKFCVYCGEKVHTHVIGEEKSGEPVFTPASPAAETVPDKTENIYEEKSYASVPAVTEEKTAEKQDRHKKKLSVKKKVIIAVCAALAALALIFGLLSIHSEERKIYRQAKADMENEDWYAAEKKFSYIKDYRKSEELFNECHNKARYYDAVSKMESGTTEDAKSAMLLLSDISGYEDSDELYEECQCIIAYNEAQENLDGGYYYLAIDEFENLGDYRDSREKVEICRKNIEYDDAIDCMDSGKYEEAMEKFKALSGFEDSDGLYERCENLIKYDAAKALYEDGKYDEAKTAFTELGDFEESSKYVSWCDCVEVYNEAKAKMEDEDYTGAKELFKQCADRDYEDSYELYNKCVKFESCEEDYQKALALYKAGKYYSAMKAFEAISGYKDSDSKAESCVRSTPSSGEMYHNSSYKSSAVYLKITAPSSYNTYLKIYKSGTLVSTVFIRKGGSASVNLPGGTYTIDADYGTTWYGTAESFGPSGSYCTLLNGSSTSFSLSSGSWSLQLLASTSGNVGSKSRSWGS